MSQRLTAADVLRTKKLREREKTYAFAVSFPTSIVEEIEKQRGFDTRSGFLLKAVVNYLREQEEEQEEVSKTGVRGSKVSSQQAQRITSTSTGVHQPQNQQAFSLVNLGGIGT